MQGTGGVVDFVAVTQGVQIIALARMQLFGHFEGVGHTIADGFDRYAVKTVQLGIEKTQVERCIVNDQFGARNELQ